jgi:hypothetical protein
VFRRFIWKVKQAQRVARKYLLINHARQEVLHNLWTRLEAVVRRDERKEKQQRVSERAVVPAE